MKFLIKILHKVAIKDNFFSLIKEASEKLAANILLEGECVFSMIRNQITAVIISLQHCAGGSSYYNQPIKIN